jgi:hypothetical protein
MSAIGWKANASPPGNALWRNMPVTVSQGIGFRIIAMNTKAIAVLLIIGLAFVLGVVLRTANRADAAAGDCYSEGPGPSEPTICS